MTESEEMYGYPNPYKPRYASSPIMQFHYCDRLLGDGDYTDYFGRSIVLGPRSQIRCRFPRDHDGPCANVEYRKIEYPSSDKTVETEVDDKFPGLPIDHPLRRNDGVTRCPDDYGVYQDDKGFTHFKLDPEV